MLCNDFNLPLFHYVTLNDVTCLQVTVCVCVILFICLFTCLFYIYLLSTSYMPCLLLGVFIIQQGANYISTAGVGSLTWAHFLFLSSFIGTWSCLFVYTLSTMLLSYQGRVEWFHQTLVPAKSKYLLFVFYRKSLLVLVCCVLMGMLIFFLHICNMALCIKEIVSCRCFPVSFTDF